MTTPCELVQIEYQGDGSQVIFPFPFPYEFKTEVKVAIWNNTQKRHVDIETTDATYPWEVSDANPTAITFTSTAPPVPPTPGVNEDSIYNVRVYRITDLTDIRAVFNQGSAIRATDLNRNFDQLRSAIQEGKCQVSDKVFEYLEEYYWNKYDETIYSTANGGTWVSNDQKIPSTAAADERFVDQVNNETIGGVKTFASSPVVPAPTSGTDATNKTYVDTEINDKIDEAITNDIGTDGTGITITDDGDGTITLGLGENSIDFDRIKDVDIITEAEQTAQSPSWGDTYIPTAGAVAERHDLIVSTSTPTTTQIGKLWFNSTASVNSLNMWDGSNWKVVTSGTPYIPQGTTIVRYVDGVNGSDAADVTGFLPQAPLRSIGRALTLINTSATGDGTLVLIAPGVYQETLPLRIQKNNVSLIGTSLRSCFVHPTVATETNSMFEVDSGSYIANLTMLGLKVPTANQGTRDNLLDNDATYGLPSNQPFAIRFRTDTPAVVIKSPYIQNCTNFCDAHFDNANFDPNTFPSTDAQTYSAVAGDRTSAPTGGGLLIDGSAVSSSSPLRSMVVDSFTQICLDGPGVLVTNNGYAQLVSFFGTFTHYHAKAKNGGQINLSNCVTDFGRYGLIADGKSPSPIASATITSPSTGAGNGSSTVTIGAVTTDPSFHGTVTQPLNHMMITIDGVDYGVVESVANGGGWDVTLSSPLTSNISSTTANFALRSYISTGGHIFEFVGVGTDYSDLPDNGGVPVEANQTIELNGGKVWQSSTNHIGKFKVGSIFTVDQVAETVSLKDTNVTGNITVTGTVDGRDVAADGTKLDGIEAGANVYTNSDVDSHLNTATAGTNEVLSWTGSDYDWVAQTAGGTTTAITDGGDFDDGSSDITVPTLDGGSF